MPWKDRPFGWGKADPKPPSFPVTREATVEALQEVETLIASGASIGHVVFKTDTLEPPSVELAIQLMLDRAGSKLKFKRVASSVPSPDPRKSTASYPLWKFRFGKPRPVSLKSDTKVEAVCREIVVAGKDGWEDAQKRSAEFSAKQIGSILGVMVSPPRIDAHDECDPSQWLRRVQVAAAQLAISIEMDQGISIADSRVADVVLGPLDWTIDAALVALAQRAKSQPEVSAAVCELARKLLIRTPSAGSWSCRGVAEEVVFALEKANRHNEDSTAPFSNNPYAPPAQRRP